MRRPIRTGRFAGEVRVIPFDRLDHSLDNEYVAPSFNG
jgi:hypothetical protein